MASPSSAGRSESWVVIHCPTDDSHCLVDDTTVIYENALNVGDDVQFAFPGVKELLTGTVKGVSTNKKAMVKLQDRLNAETKPKRDTSFYAGAPRKAAVKCKEKGFRINVPKKGRTVKGAAVKKPHVKVGQQTILSNVTGAESTDTSVDSSSVSEEEVSDSKEESSNTVFKDIFNDSDTSDGDFTAEELKLLEKIGRRKSTAEFQELRLMSRKRCASAADGAVRSKFPKLFDAGLASTSSQGSNEKQSDTSSDKFQALRLMAHKQSGSANDDAVRSKVTKVCDANIASTSSHGSNEKQSDESSDNFSDDKFPEELGNGGAADESNQDKDKDNVSLEMPDGNVETGKKKRKKKAYGAQSNSDVTLITFEGDHFNHKKDDPKVVQLYEGDVYILEKEMRKAKDLPNASKLARFLTRAVFTKEARNICSVSGKKSLAKGSVKPEKRTMLDQDGVDAIIEFVTHRCEKKGWKTPTESVIKQIMGNMLCEERQT